MESSIDDDDSTCTASDAGLEPADADDSCTEYGSDTGEVLVKGMCAVFLGEYVPMRFQEWFLQMRTIQLRVRTHSSMSTCCHLILCMLMRVQ